MSTETIKTKIRWGVYYRGVLATDTLTEKGAYAEAGKLIIQRGWDGSQVAVKQFIKEVRP